MKIDGEYRTVSWFFTWKDLAWPNDDIADDIRRRADSAAEKSEKNNITITF